MNKKGFQTAACVSVASVWVGGHFGPGFATGTSMTTWFMTYGIYGLFLPLVAMAVTGGTMYFMIEYARRYKANNYKTFATSLYGDKAGKIMLPLFDLSFLITIICAGGLCLSGLASLLEAHLGLPYWCGIALTIAVVALMCLYGPAILGAISAYMMYFIIAAVILIVVVSFAFGEYDMAGAFANASVNAKNPSFGAALWKAVLYGFFQSGLALNVVAVTDILKDKQDSKKAALVGYVINVFLMILVILMMFSYTNVFDVVGETLPIYTILTRIGFGWLTWIYVILMTLAVLSSAAGMAYSGTVRFDALFKGIKNAMLRKCVITVLLLGLAAAAASFGFKSLMSTGNAILGYINIFVLIIPAYTLVRSKIKGEE